jgi:hypothetical protein
MKEKEEDKDEVSGEEEQIDLNKGRFGFGTKPTFNDVKTQTKPTFNSSFQGKKEQSGYTKIDNVNDFLKSDTKKVDPFFQKNEDDKISYEIKEGYKINTYLLNF